MYNAQAGGQPIDPYGWAGGGPDPWPYNLGYLWMTHPPRPPYFTHYQPIAGVINAGGNGDIALRDSTNGRFYFRWGDGGGSSFCCETPYDWAVGDHYEAFTADIDNNGCGDIGLRDPNNGDFYVHYGNCNGGFGGQTQFDWAPGYHYRPFVCDVNADGWPDAGLRDPYNGKFYFKYGNGSGQFYEQKEWTWAVGVHYQPLARDFNLDGRCDIGLRDPNNGVFYIRWGNGNGTFGNQVQYDWGAPGYHYVPFTIRISIAFHWGDIGLRDPNNGRWYFRKGNGGGGFCCQTEFPWAPT